MVAEPLFVGIDVSRDRLDVAFSPDGPVDHVPNVPDAIAILVSELAKRNCGLIVREATGGYEVATASSLAAAGLPVVVANPRQTREFARATGRFGKTNAVDARGRALFAERIRAVGPERRSRSPVAT